MEPVPAAGRYNFSVENVDQWWTELQDHADVVEPLHDTPYGTRKFTIRDPDGNELTLHKRYAPYAGGTPT